MHSLLKVFWDKMGIPEGRLNIAVSEDILHGNQIDSRHDSSIR